MLIKIYAPGLQDYLRYHRTIPLDDRNLPLSKERLKEFLTKEASCYIAIETDIFDILPGEVQKVFVANTQDMLKIFMNNFALTAHLDICQLIKNNKLKISLTDFLYQKLLETHEQISFLSKDILEKGGINK